jgi:hypothetical protein
MAEGSDAITGKFDFYDILGYLVPGLVLIGLLWLPFGLIKGIWPSSSLTSAVLYLVCAHILGHILQGFCVSGKLSPKSGTTKANCGPLPLSCWMEVPNRWRLRYVQK